MSTHSRHDVDLAYLAGIIDADGYVTATYVLRGATVDCGAQVGITGSRREPHDLASAIFGGNVTQHHPTGDRRRHKTQHHWQRTGRRAVPVIEAVLPYLRVKAEQARLVLALQESVDLLRSSRLAGDYAPWQLPGYSPAHDFRVAVDEIRELNARRGRSAGTV